MAVRNRTLKVALPRCAVGVLIVTLASCAPEDPRIREKQGAVIGAVTGAVVGHQIDKDKGRFVGAAIGALTGASVGRYQDAQQREIEEALARERQAKEIEIQRLQDDTLKVSLSAKASFDFDQSQLKPAFYPALDRLAELLVKYDKTMLHVIGHTDSTGSDQYNQALSIRRAQEVTQYLIVKAVPASRIRTEGRGESEPRVANDSESNRMLNRRVEIYIKPVVQGSEDDALESPAPS